MTHLREREDGVRADGCRTGMHALSTTLFVSMRPDPDVINACGQVLDGV
jgi:hypothetical protein